MLSFDLFSASECREWLIHFSTAVLNGILGPEPYVHYLLLVTAMSLLTKYGVSLEEVGYAETLLEAFCETFPAIYGELIDEYGSAHVRKYCQSQD